MMVLLKVSEFSDRTSKDILPEGQPPNFMMENS